MWSSPRDLLVRVAPRDEPQHLALARRELVELGIDRGGALAGERVEHEPGQPGENTASPSCTRAIASTSSPARSSSSRSRGRRRGSSRSRPPPRRTPTARGTARRASRRTARSPLAPLPSGRCTSSSTTSGSVSRDRPRPRRSTSPASPTISTPSPSSVRTPDRNSRWSSTRKTRIALDALAGITQPDLGAPAGLRSRSARSRRALACAPRSTRRCRGGRRGTRRASNPTPWSRTYAVTASSLDLDVHRDAPRAPECRAAFTIASRARVHERAHAGRRAGSRRPSRLDRRRGASARPRRRRRRARRRASRRRPRPQPP